MHDTPGQAKQSRRLLRTQLRSRRRALSAQDRRRLDAHIGRHLLELVESRRARSIACYWPFNGEPDIVPACRRLMAAGCRLALPVISEQADHGMTLHAWGPDSVLTANRYGILEPRPGAPLPPADFDILFMPMVGYDSRGNRLGMGSGYYDRYLEALRDSARPLRVGIAYSLQETDPLAADAWDVPVHGVVNECGWLAFSRGPSSAS